MKLVTFGATGTIGRQVVQQALDQGHTVTAFAHNLAKLNIQHPQLIQVQGDVMDSVAVESAICGQDAVVCVLGSGKKLTGTIRSEGTQQIIQAMKSLGVRRLICQSTLGVGDSWSNLDFYWKYIMFSFILRKVFADHERQEALVKNSGLDWTIVRPGAFIDGPLTGQYRHSFPSTDRTITLQISRADVANFILKQFSDESSLQQTPSLSY
ncbi:SDR family oxidoreductase [Synechocystis sp. PCC 7339]|uniref:NAD(P)-dependent oxidoreductase n=1 Tax=unclassified Synechocystis TaxID=2640012 RepID=UPI001BB0C785|nr:MULTISPECIES: SDR family oxidoreductase [unclassified Synechocystis]QUS59562.1 SDR family oxidoreductase [Synechocystis sp. PCC 7338]UAJ71748.1 SDR family oxidoreductase [Synechocystis sp. PCC 7339]